MKLPTRTEFRSHLIMPDGRPLGVAASDEQRRFLAALDDVRRNLFGITVRGFGKTLLTAAEDVTESFYSPPGGRLYVIAVDQQQAALLHEAAVGFLTRTPHLLPSVDIQKWTIRVPATDTVLTVLPSDAPSAYGLTPTWVCVDELFQLEGTGKDMFTAIYTALPKRNGRLICISTPGAEQAGWCWRLLQIAKSSPDRWVYFESTETPPWVDKAWLDEQREFLPASVFARFHGGRFTDPEGALFTAETVDRVFHEALLPGFGGYGAVGVDLALTGDYAAAVRVKMEGRAKRFVVEEIKVWRAPRDGRISLQEIQDALPAMGRGYARDIPYYVDAWQAALFAEQARKAGLNVQEVAFTKPARDELYQALLRAVQTGKLQSRPHEQFRAELLGLRVEQTPSGFRVDHRRNSHDDICIATALALVGLQRLLENSFVYAGRGVDGKVVVVDPFAHTQLTPLQRSIYSQGGE